MAKGLSAAGYEVKIFTGMPSYPQGRVFPAYRHKYFLEETENAYKIFRHWLYPLKSNTKAHRFLNMFSPAVSVFWSLPHLLRWKPDICIVQYPPMLLPFSALLIAKLTNAQFILNVSDLWPQAILKLGMMRKGLGYKLLKKMALFLYRRAHCCLAQSEEIRHYLRTSGQNNVLLYRTGVDTDLFGPEKKGKPIQKIREETQEENAVVPQKKQAQKTDISSHNLPFRIVYFGVLGLAHNLYRLVAQLDFELLDTVFHIYGNGLERKKIETLIAKQKLHNVKLYNPVGLKRVAGLMHDYDAVLICQKKYVYGTLPAKLYEAMAAGMPVLFHGAGEGAQIIRETACGLVSSPENVGMLEENIQKMKQLSAQERQKMGDLGRKKALQSFARSKQIKKLLAWLDEKNNSGSTNV